MVFYNLINDFLHKIYNGKICEKQFCNTKIIFIPEKKLAFLPVAIPVQSYKNEDKYIFQQNMLNAEKQGIHLITIYEDIWNTRNALVKNRITTLAGSFTRIHARLCLAQKIDKQQSDDFLQKNHLYGTTTTKHKFGLFFKNELVAVATFSGGRPIERNGKTYRSYELVRFANAENIIVAGGLSKLLSHFIEQICPDDIMTYADLDWSTGNSYSKLGFEFISVSEPQEFWIDKITQTRYSLHKLPENIQQEILLGQSQNDVLNSAGFVKIYNCGNKKFLKLLK